MSQAPIPWPSVAPFAIVALLLSLAIGPGLSRLAPAPDVVTAPTAIVLPSAAATAPRGPAPSVPAPSATPPPPTATGAPTAAATAQSYLQPAEAAPPPVQLVPPAMAPQPVLVEAPTNTPSPLMPILTSTPEYSREAPSWAPPLVRGVDPGAPTAIPLVLPPDQVPAYAP